MFRIVDTKNYIWYIRGIITGVEYDPTRYSLLHLIIYSNGILTYNLAISENKIGQTVSINLDKYLQCGNKINLLETKRNFLISNIEIYSKKRAQYIKTYGNYGKIIVKFLLYSLIKLKSKEIIRLNNDNIITLGSIHEYKLKFYKKASYFRYKGWRPHVRGVAKNPIDHPLGGGQGKTSGGRPSCNFSGKCIKGQKSKKKKIEW